MWNDFKEKTITFEGRKALIIYPKGKPNGKMILKTEYLGAFPNFDIEMLSRGYHLIHITHRNRWATDLETDIMADFVRYCAKELGTSERVIVEGMSCGGLQAAQLARRHPELCAVLYLDAPVLNILSMAGLGALSKENADSFWLELVDAFGFNRSTVVNFRNSPIDDLAPLIENEIPVIMLYGNADDVVLYEENGRVLENYYKENGGTLEVICRSMGHHHPHGLDDPMPIIEFVEANYN